MAAWRVSALNTREGPMPKRERGPEMPWACPRFGIGPEPQAAEDALGHRQRSTSAPIRSPLRHSSPSELRKDIGQGNSPPRHCPPPRRSRLYPSSTRTPPPTASPVSSQVDLLGSPSIKTPTVAGETPLRASAISPQQCCAGRRFISPSTIRKRKQAEKTSGPPCLLVCGWPTTGSVNVMDEQARNKPRRCALATARIALLPCRS